MLQDHQDMFDSSSGDYECLNNMSHRGTILPVVVEIFQPGTK